MNNNTNFENDAENDYSDATETYYKATIDDMDFQILKLEGSTSAQYSIIDSKGHDCVHVIVQERRDEKRLYLSQLTYRPTCAIGKDMARGKNTINMMKSLLIFLMKDTTFDTVYLKDKSTIDCILPDDDDSMFPISLAKLSFILYGKTWYQRHFGAEILNPDMAVKLNNSDAELTSTINMELLNNLKTTINHELRAYSTHNWYKSLYVTCMNFLKSQTPPTTWRELFFTLFSDKGHIAKTTGLNIGCLLFESLREWFAVSFDIPDITSINMFISRNTIESYPEWNIPISINNSPVHTNVSRKETLMRSAMLLNFPYTNIGNNNNRNGMYLVGGKKTMSVHKRKSAKYVKHVKGHLLSRRKCKKGTRKIKRV